jgi:betaine-aldehyde dehydrogenase
LDLEEGVLMLNLPVGETLVRELAAGCAFSSVTAGEPVTAARDAEWMAVVDPATEKVLARVAESTTEVIDAAYVAAARAAADWRELGWHRRALLLGRLADRLAPHAEAFARLDAIDSGSPITGMRGDAKNATDILRYFAGVAGEVTGRSYEARSSGHQFSVREPYGVITRIIPFNHPYQFAVAKVAAPLVAGNAVVLKPAHQTPLSAMVFVQIAQEILPPGVLNLLIGGARVGSQMVRHPLTTRVAFTGGVEAGASVMREAADGIKEVSLELGGKNPMLVFSDADPEKAAGAAVDAMNFRRSQGQSCQSMSRIFVDRVIAPAFTEALVAQVAALRIGDPLLDDTEMGPVAFEQHRDRILAHVAGAVGDGAVLACGGGRPAGFDVGYFVQGTVLTDVTQSMAIANEEVFGPVVSVLPFTDPRKALADANSVRFGLTANVWTKDIDRALSMAHGLEAGYVWINGRGRRRAGQPFGGYKQSGIGKENSIEEVYSYTREKMIDIVHDA